MKINFNVNRDYFKYIARYEMIDWLMICFIYTLATAMVVFRVFG